MTDLPPLDRLSPLFERFRVRASLFHAGPLCGVTHFDAQPGRGFLHVMRTGEMEIRHAGATGLVEHLWVREPSLVFYPRPLAHDFHNAPADGSEFVCATLDFEAGHPLVQALPALVVLPLARVDGIGETLSLLFGEAERVRCGQRLLADRLFEVLLLQLPEAFRGALGQTPADYLADWRLAIARNELRAGKPLKLLAAELGYANASALSRLFAHKHAGLSPRAWLQRG
ncbi:MAG: helix-turn-helix domain-containing protein [Rubrivivax sp.]|nr:MAG: helix-turn-helix domain-containing protein [Rubrivivax sp.]